MAWALERFFKRKHHVDIKIHDDDEIVTSPVESWLVYSPPKNEVDKYIS